MNLTENISLAFAAVKSNKLRTFLTLLSVSIGVFAITGAGALVQSIDATVNKQLEDLGETVYYMQRTPMIQMGNWRQYASRKPLDYRLYNEVKQHSKIPIDWCVYTESYNNIVKYNEEKTDADVIILAADQAFMPMLNYHPDNGRAFTEMEIQQSSRVVVVGDAVIKKIMPNVSNPLGKKIKIKDYTFTIIGTSKPKGAIAGQSQDNYVIVPITWYIKYGSRHGRNTDLIYCAKAPSLATLNAAMDESTGILRSLRNCKPWEPNNFEIYDNSAFSDMFADLTQYLGIFGAGCGLIALVAAGVGIMNIMLVSVKERTREIGVRKAVGAKSISILAQFLIEAVTLCLIGALIGIIIGIVIGGMFGALIGMSLGIPILWIVVSITACTILGIVSGAYPAWKAAKLNPIDALRYE